MEDKFIFSVPMRKNDTGVRRKGGTDDTTGSYGEAMMGANAIFYNIIQSLTGAGIVDYNSITDFWAGGARDGQLMLIDTSIVDPSGLTGSGATRYTAGLGTKANYGTNTYNIVMQGNSTYKVIDATGGSVDLYNPGTSSTTFNMDTQNTVVTSSGDSTPHMTIYVSSGSTNVWQANDTYSFIINENTGDSKVWSEPFQEGERLATGTNTGSRYTILYRDSGRGTTASPDYVSIWMETDVSSVRFSTTENLNLVSVSGDMGLMNAATSRYYSPLFMGDYITTPGTNTPNAMYLFRGEAYIRGMIFVGSSADQELPDLTNAEWERTNPFFVGNMLTYVAYSEWPRPVAVLACDGHQTDPDRNFPFMKTEAPTEHVARSTGWTIPMPFLLSRPGTGVEPHVVTNTDPTAISPEHVTGAAAAISFTNSTKFVGFDGFDNYGISHNTVTANGDVSAETGMYNRVRAPSRDVPGLVLPLQMFHRQSYEIAGGTSLKQDGLAVNPANARRGVLGEIPGMYWIGRERDSRGLTASDWTEESTHAITSIDDKGNSSLHYLIRGYGQGGGVANDDTLGRSGIMMFRNDPL